MLHSMTENANSFLSEENYVREIYQVNLSIRFGAVVCGSIDLHYIPYLYG